MFIVTINCDKQKHLKKKGLKVLDDLKYIHEKDGQDALGIAAKQARQLNHKYNLLPKPQTDHVYNIVFAGMGGSALASVITKAWLDLPEPFEIIRGYKIPSYVDGDTLFIASSYSGNTEETISALEEAEQKGAQIAVIASGGKLVAIAEEKGYPLARLPGGLQPRYAVMYNLKALATILDAFGLTKSSVAELEGAVPALEKQITDYMPTVPASKNPAKELAKELLGVSVVIYSGPLMFPATYKWKININENAKQVAWCNQLPEFNHNEMIGWTEQPTHKPYKVVDIVSPLEDKRILKRFEVTARLLSGKRPSPLVISPVGERAIDQLLWAIMLGDFVSLYLALLNGLNPTPVELVEKFKTELDK